MNPAQHRPGANREGGRIAGLNYLEILPTEGQEALTDDLENAPRFGAR
jgi:hypothetical protein